MALSYRGTGVSIDRRLLNGGGESNRACSIRVTENGGVLGLEREEGMQSEMEEGMQSVNREGSIECVRSE